MVPRSSLIESRSPLAARAAQILPAAHADGREHRRLRPRNDGVRHVLPALAVHAAGARVLGARDRRRLPRRRADGDRRLRRRPGTRDAGRGAPHPRDRTGLDRWRAHLLHADLARRLVRRRPAARASCWSASDSASRSCPSRSPPCPGIPPHEAGLASGLINTSQQIGGALGVAILTTVSTTRTENLLGGRDPAAGRVDRRVQPRLLGRGRGRWTLPARNAAAASAVGSPATRPRQRSCRRVT